MERTKIKNQAERRRAAHRRAIERMQANKAMMAEEYRRKSLPLSNVSAEQAAVLFDQHCPYCDRLLIPRIECYEIIPGRLHTVPIWPDLCGCPEEAEALKLSRQQAELSAAQIQEQVRCARLKRAGLVGWLAGADFEQFQPRHDWPEAMECKRRVMAYVEALAFDSFEVAHHPVFRPHKKNWLILHGHFGNGKTLLAAAMVRTHVDTSPSYFRVWPDYERRIRESYQPESRESEADIIAELQQGGFVAIDDLDKRKATEFTRGVLYSVLNYRYNSELPTVLTFNYGPEDIDPKAPGRLVLEEFLGTAVLDRILGSAFDVIEFDGPSYRSGIKW